jgi:hypothetical protein
MKIFWSAPFEYQLRDLIQAKVIAVNERGASIESDPNTVGSLTRTVPGKMDSVTRGSDTSAYQVQV